LVGDISPDASSLLAFANDLPDQVKVALQFPFGKLGKEFSALPKLRLQNNGDVSVLAQCPQMKTSEDPQLGLGVLGSCQFFFGATIKSFKGAVERRHQDLLFGLEVKI